MKRWKRFGGLSMLGAAALLFATVPGHAADDDYGPDEEVVVAKKPAKAKRTTARKSRDGFNAKFDVARAELGHFLDDPGQSGDAWLHGAVSGTGRSGDLEYALGARFDAYAQTGTPDFTRARLDYTENYLRWRGDGMRLTLGTQNVLWGRVDEISPIDRMSRVDLSRLNLDKLPERRRAVPAARLERFVGDYRIDAVWLPVFDAAVLPHADSAWHPVDTRGGRILGIGSHPALVGARVREDEHGSGGAGVRVTHGGGDIDFGFSLQRVRQSLPYYRINPGARTELVGVHPYGWTVGGELETQKAGATWRMEMAWSSDLPVTTRTFQYRTERALDLVIGAEFFPGDADTRVTLQLAGHRTFTDQPTLDRDRMAWLTGEIEHPFAQGRWRANLRFIAGLDEREYYWNPKLAWLGIDGHEFHVAAHLYSGDAQTLGGHYRRNDLLSLGWQAKF